jgi:glycosyltransferase involved in cell wall biosynthesis
VRIGVEMFGTQTGGRDRGIGRYARNLAAALRARGEAHGHAFVFYAVEGLPTDRIPEGPNALVRTLRPEPHLRYTLNRLVAANPDGLDALVFVNPLEMNPGLDMPARHADRPRPSLLAVVHDLIPWLFQDDYLRRWPGTSFARRYLWGLERLRGYDRLLANSCATRADLLRVLNLPGDRVETIGAAGDDRGVSFTPDRVDPEDDDRLRDLGIDPATPFVLTVAGPDPHKNLDGLLAAWSRLPAALRESRRLVVAAGAAETEKLDALRRRAEAEGVADGLALLTRPVDDETLRALYRRCEAFAFPSLYEGFGLPVLEALRCGAAVVAGESSSLPEVTGDAGLLVNAADPSALAAGLASVLNDPAKAETLRALGPERASAFTWDAVAARALDAISGSVVGNRVSSALPGFCGGGSAPLAKRHADRRNPVSRTIPGFALGTTDRPRVAVCSPLPPEASGVADYAGALVEALGEHAALDLFHDTGRFPATRFARRDCGVFDHRLLARFERLRPYRAVVYQMGNSPAHHFVHELLNARPGVVVLHDLALASYHYERATRPGGGGRDAFRAALAESHPDRADEFDRHLARWFDDPERMVRGLTDAGFDMNAAIVAAAHVVVVHSRAAADRLGPAGAGKTVVIPHGATPASMPPTTCDRGEARARLGLPGEALVVGNFGIVHPSKGNAKAVAAFATVARAHPGALMIIVGAEADGGYARRQAHALGLGDRVRFLGRLDDERFAAAVVASDLAVALRRPPTNGETSGALLHVLRRGVPAVAADTGSFAEYPPGCVRRVPWPADDAGVAALGEVLLGLASDADARAALGRAGLEHVRAHHAWPLVAAWYAEVLLGPAPGLLRGPHRAGSVITQESADR